MQAKSIAAALLLFNGLLLEAQSLTPMAQFFSDLKSNDVATESAAKNNFELILEKELPTIEKDSTAICNALTDSSSVVRSAAAGVYATIVLAAPEHNQVVAACTTQLIKTAADPHDATQQNSLLALAMNTTPPPSEAANVFRQALTLDNAISVQAGTTGLLRENGKNSQMNIGNISVILAVLQNADTPTQRVAILKGIVASQAKSDVLFQASQRMLGDTDRYVKHAALSAVASSGPDNARIASVMQQIVDSPISDHATKQNAAALLNRLQPTQ